MKSIIDEIYTQNIGRCESIKETEEYWQAQNKLCELLEDFESLISPQLKEKCREIIDLCMYASGELAQNHYKEGVKFGVKLCVETLV